MNPPSRTRPRSRYRIYGGWPNYLRFVADFVAGAHRRHQEVPALERALATRWGSNHAVCGPLARVCIYALLRHYGRPGGYVLLSPYTIVDVVNMVLAAGLTPRFVDVNPQTGNLDEDALRQADFRDVCAILLTHLHGVTACSDSFRAIANAAGVPLIEDAAQAMGARVSGRYVGTIGDAGVFSLGSYKNINAWFGGVVVTESEAVAAAVRAEFERWPTFAAAHLLRKVRESAVTDLLGAWPVFDYLLFPLFRQAFLRDWERLNRLLRIELDTRARPSLPNYYQGRFTDLQARSAAAQLGGLESHTQTRIRAASMYHEGLRGLPGIGLPPAPDGERHVYTYFPIQVRDRFHLLKWFQHFGRDVAAQHLHDVSALPDFRRYEGNCPTASRVAKSVVLLPTYPGYDDDQVVANIDVIRWYVRSGEPAYR